MAALRLNILAGCVNWQHLACEVIPVIFSVKFLFALLLDWLCGDPRWLPHPVRAIGRYCLWLEKTLRIEINNAALAGRITVLMALVTVFAVMVAIFLALRQFSPVWAEIFAVYLLYSSIAMRDLIRHSQAVYSALTVEKNIHLARQEVAKIVGRETAHLDEEGVSRACIESVAENTADGVTAPVFWAIVWSLLPGVVGLSPLAMAATGAYLYKTVNTMDSLFGYKNEKYLLFGRCAALLDDAVNYLPARLSGLVMAGSAVCLGLSVSRALKIFWRDRLAHASPNSGHTEAAMAGALGVQLGGVSVYFGKSITKPVLGDALRQVESADIVLANRLMVCTSLVFTVGLLFVRVCWQAAL